MPLDLSFHALHLSRFCATRPNLYTISKAGPLFPHTTVPSIVWTVTISFFFCQIEPKKLRWSRKNYTHSSQRAHEAPAQVRLTGRNNKIGYSITPSKFFFQWREKSMLLVTDCWQVAEFYSKEERRRFRVLTTIFACLVLKQNNTIWLPQACSK
jgi:hypothetical protein